MNKYGMNEFEMVKKADVMRIINTEPVRHGRWIRHKITCSSMCSECKKYTTAETPRCPYCGAYLQGGADNANN